MNKQELTIEEKKLLLYCLQRWQPELVSKLDVLDLLTPDVINIMRDVVSVEVGEALKAKNSIYADQLEDLIDRLLILYVRKC